jgi:Concanavalin A-like lectin/glucanases superfamily
MKTLYLTLIIALLSCTVAWAQPEPFKMDDQTVLLMHFDGDLKNEAEKGNPATAEEDDLLFVKGVMGQAISFAGPPDVVKVPERDDFALSMRKTNSFTMEFWVKTRDIVAKGWSKKLIIKGSGSCYNVGMVTGNNIYYTFYGHGKWQSAVTKVAVEKNKWTHIAVCYDVKRTQMKVFKDGVLAEIVKDVLPNNQVKKTPVQIGGPVGKSAKSYTLRGEMDEVRISKVVRYDPESKAKVGDKVFEVKAVK